MNGGILLNGTEFVKVIWNVMAESGRMMKPIRAVIFDMDGLMIDSERIYWRVGRELAREYGKEVSDVTLGRMMGRSPLNSAEIFASELGIDVSPKELLDIREIRVKRALEQGVDAMPGLLQALSELKQKYLLAIATSAPMYLAEIVIRTLDLEAFFKVIQTSDGIVKGKPDPEIYLAAMEKLGMDPSETVVLEDSSNGALAGKRAGAYVIAVPSRYTEEQEFGFVDALASDLIHAAALIQSFERSRR